MPPHHDDQEFWRFRNADPLPRTGKTLIMGIINMTPDSFSGRNAAPTAADGAALALSLLEAGADMVDFGAESSRPGAVALDAEEEINRLGDVVARVRARTRAPLSVDTYHPETAARVLGQGADIINDISALRGGWSREHRRDSPMAELVARERAHIVLMHMPASPGEMQQAPSYADPVAAVHEFLVERASFAERAGVARERIWLDPGFGFGKTFNHNRELLRHLSLLVETGFPVLAGLSRKRMIADALNLPVEERLEASLALAVMASLNGAAIVRVHDVRETVRAVGMADAVRLGLPGRGAGI